MMVKLWEGNAMMHPTEGEELRAVIYGLGAAFVVTLVGRIVIATW